LWLILKIKMIRKILFVILIFTVGCSSDDSNIEHKNGFSINGTFYETSYFAPSGQTGITRPLILAFFQDKPETTDIATYGLFQLLPNASGAILGEYEIYENAIEFLQHDSDDVIEEDEIFISTLRGQNRNGFISGRANIQSAEFDNKGEVIFIQIEYEISWEGIKVNGFFRGNARDDS